MTPGESARRIVPMADRHPRPTCLDEAGSGTLLVLIGCVLMAVVASAAAVLSSVLVTRTRVAAAADLGALAVASAALEPESVACSRARSVVRANGAQMLVCRVSGVEAWVEVRAPAPPVVARLTGGRTAYVSARAHSELVAPPLDWGRNP